jgi:pimeloyl-ACP methyl ester carboxylesterase
MDKRRIRLGSGLGVELLESGAADGARPLLLVHGFTGAKEDFADHLDHFASLGWHVVAPDLRGHGGSDHPAGAGAYSLRSFAADVLGVADALGWDRFTLLGHSLGGMVVQHVAIDAPHRLDALVLMDTSHGVVEGIDPEVIALGKAVVSEGGMPALVEASRGLDGGLDTPAYLHLIETKAGYREFVEGKSLASSPDMWLAMVDELLVAQPDRLADLAALRVPTLVIVGEQDTPFLEPSQRMSGAIAGSRLVVIRDAGHSPQFENPPAWRAAMDGFLASVADGSASAVAR